MPSKRTTSTKGVVNGKGLGRVRPPDWRHVEQYPVRALAGAARNALTAPDPQTVVRHPLPFRYDQGATPRCCDFGSCTLMSSIELQNEQERIQFTPGHLYRWAVRHDGIPGDPGGTTVRATMDYIRRLGLVPRHRRHGRRQITENRWCETMDEVVAVLARQAVPIGVSWTTDMMEPDAEGFIHATGREVGGHYVVLFGEHLPQGYVDVGQTWGPGWWSSAPSQEESWNGKLSLEDLERLLFSMDGEAVVITDELERRV
jgi:hypothetical protein